jgi:hypothetical protein
MAWIILAQNKSTKTLTSNCVTTLKDIFKKNLNEWNLNAFIVENVDVKINATK